MSEINKRTALEIFTNPDDLAFNIAEQGGKWCIVISRGPRHKFKLLLSSEYVLESSEAAIQGIINTLQEICNACVQELTDSTTFPAQLLNPENRAPEQWSTLNAQLIERIAADLRAKGHALTTPAKQPAEVP